MHCTGHCAALRCHRTSPKCSSFWPRRRCGPLSAWALTPRNALTQTWLQFEDFNIEHAAPLLERYRYSHVSESGWMAGWLDGWGAACYAVN